MTRPVTIPDTIETGMPASFPARFTWRPVYNPSKALKTTMTNTSSSEDAAMTSVGMPLSVPFRRAAKSSIIGTTTAGETAPSTVPRIADSR